MPSCKDIRGVIRYSVIDYQAQQLAEKRVIMLDAEIDEGSASTFFLQLAAISMSKEGTIWVVLNSPGGDIDQGLAVYDTIRLFVNTGLEINVLGLGLVASMATAIIQAGTRRFTTPNTQFLIHQASRTTFFEKEEVNQSRERVEELDRINNIAMAIVAERSGTTLEFLKQISNKKDHWVDARRARELGTNGLIDEIVTRLPFTL